jgi:AmmeMemoRadiSam system protein B
MSTRPPLVAGQFYPGTRGSLLAVLDRCIPSGVKAEKAIGLVAPHAGYLYSGATAGAAFARAVIPERVAVLAPNHTGTGEPIAVWARGAWSTPLGEIPVDEELTGALLRRCPEATDDRTAHFVDDQFSRQEHSLEVQLPFIQRLNPAARILPVCVGTHDKRALASLGDALAEVVRGAPGEVLIVASSDMTHFEPAAQARTKDDLAIARVRALDPEGLLATVRKHSISMCGVAPVAAMLWAAKSLGAKECELVDYSHSGMVTGDHSEVVGYAGLVVR